MKKATKIWLSVSTLTVVAIIVVLLVLQPWKPKEPEVIKIGAIFSLTGSAATYGERSVEGMNIALEKINESGGINGKDLVIITEDDRTDGKDAVAALQKLINIDQVRVVIGPCASSLALVCAPIANDNKVVLMATTIASDQYSTPDDFTFRNWPSARFITKQLAELIYNKQNISKIAILYLNNDMGKAYEAGFRETYQALGGKIVISEGYNEGELDFKTYLWKVKNANAEALLIVGHTESAYILKQLKELGIEIPIYSEIGIEDPKIKEVAGNLINGIIYVAPSYDYESNISEVKEYEQRYFEKYGHHSDVFAACAYDAVMIVAEAIKEVGNDSEDVKKYLLNLKGFHGVTGNISFDENGDVQKDVSVKEVINGEYIFLDENLKPMK